MAASFIAIFLIPVTFYVVEKLSHRGKKDENTEHGLVLPEVRLVQNVVSTISVTDGSPFSPLPRRELRPGAFPASPAPGKPAP